VNEKPVESEKRSEERKMVEDQKELRVGQVQREESETKCAD
jgi:hypothetical protein